jgi:hypothetical protein
LFSLFFGGEGFDKVSESSKTLEQFKQFDMQFGNGGFAGFCGYTRPKYACVVLI